MATRTIRNDLDLQHLFVLLRSRKFPYTIEAVQGVRRSVEQNKLQRKWMAEIAEQLGDRTAEEVRGHCKLHHGVPILREESELFRAKYDQFVKPLPYPQKLALMMEPLDMPVTRLLTAAGKSKYLDEVFRQFSEMGVVLTVPADAPGTFAKREREVAA